MKYLIPLLLFFLIPGIVSAAPASINTSVLAAFPLDSDCSDISGLNNDCSLYNGALIATNITKYGGGAAYLGSNNQAINSSVILPASTNWTVSFWANPASVSNGARAFFTQYLGGSPGRMLMYKEHDGQGDKLYCFWNPDSTLLLGEVLLDEIYEHYTFMRNGTNCTVYRNSTYMTSGVCSNPLTQASYLEFGLDIASGSFGYVGYFDDLIILNRSVTSQEISNLYDYNITYLMNPPIGVETNERYIDATSGNDANNGTDISHPWKTLSKFNFSTIPAGTTLFLKRGEQWDEGLLIDENSITIDAYGSGNRPLLNGSVNWTKGTVRVTGDNFRMYNIDFINGGQETIEFDAVSDIVLINISINDSYDKSIDIDDSFDIYMQYIKLYDSGWKNRAAGAQGEGYWIQESENITIYDSVATRHGGVNLNCYRSSHMLVDNFTSIDHNPDDSPYDGLPGIYYDACNHTITTNSYVRNATIGYSVNAENAGTFAHNNTLRNGTFVNTGTAVWLESNQNGAGPYIHDTDIQYITIYRDNYYSGPSNGYAYDVVMAEVDGVVFKNNLIVSVVGDEQNNSIKLTNITIPGFDWDYNYFNISLPWKTQFESNYKSNFTRWQETNDLVDNNSIQGNLSVVDYTYFVPYNTSDICTAGSDGGHVGANECIAGVAGACVESIINTSWTAWADMTICTNNTKQQNSSLLQYDENNCEPAYTNVTHWRFQNITCGSVPVVVDAQAGIASGKMLDAIALFAQFLVLAVIAWIGLFAITSIQNMNIISFQVFMIGLISLIIVGMMLAMCIVIIAGLAVAV